MIELYNNIFRRWVGAFDEFTSLSKYRDLVKKTSYASSQRFDLKNYTPDEFPSGGMLSDEVPEDALFLRKYGFDQAGRPVHVSYAHEWNGVHWEGCYIYSDNRVEYIEFFLETGVPTFLDVIQFDGGKKTVYQHFHLNGGGYLPDGNIQGLVERAKQDQHLVWCNVEQYIYEGNIIAGANCYANSPGIGRYEYKKVYTYNQEGQLDEIKNIFSDGRYSIAYVRVDHSMSTEELVDSLARQMANAVVDTLLKNHVAQPVALLELSYQQGWSYLPILLPMSQMEWQRHTGAHDGMAGNDMIVWTDVRNMITMEAEDLQRPLQQLMQIMQLTEDFEPGTKMLHKAANFLTRSRLKGQVAVTEEFMALAIDKSMEFDDMGALFMECGQKEEVVQNWREKGWLR